jgi:high-affinity Fe2+/Pb2+ permease
MTFNRRTPGYLFVLGSACGAFAYWGMFTKRGSHAFDEMAGMMPFFVGLASGPLFLGAAVLWWLERRARSRKTQQTVDER